MAGIAFGFSKFCPPIVSDGRLNVPTYDGRIDVYVSETPISRFVINHLCSKR
jgi:hypothetical protein